MPKTLFLFADTALELIPKELYFNEYIKKYAKKNNKKPSQIILDSSYHHNAMKKLADYKKRGRPDILHLCLMNLLESTLILSNPSSNAIFIHTINNEIIEVNPKIRLPKNFDRFKGLMAKLLIQKEICSHDDYLLRILGNVNVQNLLKSIPMDKRFIFSSKGKIINLEEILEMNNENDLAIIIGAFPFGYFSTQFNNISENVFSIYPNTLNAWIVLNKIIYEREKSLKII